MTLTHLLWAHRHQINQWLEPWTKQGRESRDQNFDFFAAHFTCSKCCSKGFWKWALYNIKIQDPWKRPSFVLSVRTSQSHFQHRNNSSSICQMCIQAMQKLPSRASMHARMVVLSGPINSSISLGIRRNANIKNLILRSKKNLRWRSRTIFSSSWGSTGKSSRSTFSIGSSFWDGGNFNHLLIPYLIKRT